MVFSSYMTISILIILFLSIIISMMSFSSNPLLEKKLVFECGFNAINKNKASFSTKFFLVMILFLIFDLEIVLLLPSSVIQFNLSSAISSGVFIFLVTSAMIVEWGNGIIEWSS